MEAGLEDVYFSTLKHSARPASRLSGAPEPPPRSSIMFGEIFRFELRYQLRQPLFWIGVRGLLPADLRRHHHRRRGRSAARSAASTATRLRRDADAPDDEHDRDALRRPRRSSPSVVRDVEHHTDEIFFSLPIGKLDYLLGRFAGALVAAILTGRAGVARLGARQPDALARARADRADRAGRLRLFAARPRTRRT